MILLLNFCSLPWWLAWLIPFLLGLAIGWLLWARYRQLYEDRGRELDTMRKRISELESDLEDCRRERITAKGRIAELETSLAAAERALAEAKESAASDPPDGHSDAHVDLGDAGSMAAGFAAGAATSPEHDDDAPTVVGAGGDIDIYAGIPSDNLQIIEGVGPKMESVMKENGVDNWSSMASKSPDELRAILAKYGDKYKRIIDPETWPQQAGLARDLKWEELIVLQKELDTGRTGGSGNTDSKLEKIMIKLGLLRKFTQDDLKAIEGIGPKIAGLLNDAGIDTWRALAKTPVQQIQEILDAAGPRYKLADPKTWPKQAELAAEGKFKELQTYQDELTGGR